MTVSCARFGEDVVGLLDGTAAESLKDHVASCDACRDRAHGLRELAGRIAAAGNDFVIAPPLVDALRGVVTEEASKAAPPSPERVSVTRLRTPLATPALASAGRRPSRRTLALVLAACASVGASAFVGVKLADHQRSPGVAATKAWHGKVAKIAASGAESGTPGLSVTTPSGKIPLGEGAELKAGMRVTTDGRTRARLWFDDGSVVVLDRASELAIDASPRTLDLETGALLADVAHVDGAPAASVRTPNGDVRVLGTKLAVTAAADRTNVEVLRGEVEVKTGADKRTVAAGQEGVLAKDGRVDVAPVNDLAQRAAFGEQLIDTLTHNEDTDAPASGLGELRAKRPGRTDEKDRAVRLEKHGVKIRIAGNVARTEIDETFANDTGDELEGIYRFPLPPGAQIERLALEVDGKLVDGEFVDRAKASAIWRGAIQAAAPKSPKPREEIIWVPGPWHDPALLEWQRGGRFELRIFPIPKHGSRRVVLAYTENVAPVSGVRRYVYPLPQGSSSKIAIDRFDVDAQVLGHDEKVPVRARGYELGATAEGPLVRMSTSQSAFVPSGDLVIEYGLDDAATDATAWGYRAPSSATANGKSGDGVGNDPFVAIALRPKLPKWSSIQPRDQVLVLDAGRAMYGERFARAKRLAVQLTQEMDRRDRVTVLVCDVGCRALPGGFGAPGAPGAHDVDAFLASVTPDGASDLVGAVRAAAKVPGHDGARDLRVTLLSDGVATAGYRSSGRVATEVGDALSDPRSLLVAVPIGADADVNLLGEVARGGGGVVVPYQPGQRLETAAIDVLNATYGTTLRDVEVILPPGLHDAAPQVLPPLRAGSETIVTARMSGDGAKGDVILRGKVGGDAFEAKYPIDVQASTDAGNAFVPRLFAAARIADREREPGDGAHAELVAFSQRFAVPSRATSLLVLESEAMFKAFGIARAERGSQWTGESAALGSSVATIGNKDADRAGLDMSDALANASGGPSDESGFAQAEKKADKSPRALGGSRGASAGAPAATQAPRPTTPPPAKAAPAGAGDLSALESLSRESPWRGDRRGGRFMKKVFVRHASVSSSGAPTVSADKIAQARAALAAAPDERGKHKDLAKLLALSGQLDELGETLDQWSTRDPLDADVIVWRSDLAARRGDREGALRILGGALAASALTPADAAAAALSIGRSYERLGKPESCAFYVTGAELRSSDAEAIARAVACERREGRPAAADRWLTSVKDSQRAAITTALERLEKAKAEPAIGDVVAAATWTGGADLDVAIVDPQGRRASAVTRMKGSRIEGATTRDHETVALASGEAGAFVVELARATPGDTTPVTGSVTITAFGESQRIPFTLAAGTARAQIGRADVRWQQELVPVDGPVDDLPFAVSGPAPFDRGLAAVALSRASVERCAASGQVGSGHAIVTFVPDGSVRDAVIDDGSFSGTTAGRCVEAIYRRVRVPAFSGGPVRVGKSFTLGAPIAR